jgi:hypothetical protein
LRKHLAQSYADRGLALLLHPGARGFDDVAA